MEGEGCRVCHATDRPRSGDPLLHAGPGRLPHRGRPVHRPAARQARRKAPASVMRPFETEYEVAPGVLLHRTGGHTPGQTLPTGKDLGQVFHDHYHSYGLLVDSFEAATAKPLRKAF